MNFKMLLTYAGLVAGAVLLLSACGTAPRVLGPTVSLGPEALAVLRAVPSPELKIKTAGIFGPNYLVSNTSRAAAEYEGPLQSSLFLCGGAGPAAGPCIGIMTGLFAVAGITNSVIYSAEQALRSDADTDQAREILVDKPTLNALSARIVTAAITNAGQHGQRAAPTELAANAACALPIDGALPHAAADLDLVALEVTFEPGYQVRLTVVARVRTTLCGSNLPPSVRRLAYLGSPVQLSRDPTLALPALQAEIDTATNELAMNLNQYLHGTR